jgi:trk system potassium uptake protein TrkA
MRVIVAGAGEVGWFIAGKVSGQGHDVTIIDRDEKRIRQINDELDVRALCGSAGSAHMLLQAGIAETDLLVAVTGSDETNIVCGSLSHELGAKRVVARVDEVIYRKAPEISYRTHFGLDDLVSPEMLTALELASYVRNPGSLAVEHFARGQLEMQQLTVDRGSSYVGKDLVELDLPEGVKICSIEREGQIIIPSATDQIHHEDLITIVGQTEKVMRAREGFESGHAQTRKIVIMGGAHTAMSLARRLQTRSFRLTIIERDPNRCQILADALPHATILNGDATSLAFLNEERIGNADVFITTSSSDEANIMGAIQAKNLGVQKVMVVIHRPDYANLMEKIGIDRAVSPRVVMAQEILSLLNQGNESTLTELGEGSVQILQLAVEGQDFVGKKLRDIEMPENTLILTLQREHNVMVPQADTVFQLDDTVLVICQKQQHKKVVKLIVGR